MNQRVFINHVVKSLDFLATFWLRFSNILARFLATFWLHFGYITATFWLHYSYILATLQLHFGYITASFCLCFGYISAIFWQLFVYFWTPARTTWFMNSPSIKNGCIFQKVRIQDMLLCSSYLNIPPGHVVRRRRAEKRL